MNPPVLHNYTSFTYGQSYITLRAPDMVKEICATVCCTNRDCVHRGYDKFAQTSVSWQMSKTSCPKLPVWQLFLLIRRTKRPYTGREKRSISTKVWLKRRSVFGHGNLIKELELPSPLDYKNYLRMCTSTFGQLLELITPLYREKIQT
jgi:hypothetical protein